MSDSILPESPLAALDESGTGISRAFSALGNETRLAILLALWEASDDGSGDPVPFSELRERVGSRDSGGFNYHLEKLADDFVRKTEDGYELRRAGIKLVRVILAGVGTEAPDLESAAADKECPLCGAGVAITYDDEMVYYVCTDCDGFYGESHYPSGTLSASEVDPAAFATRDLRAAVHATGVKSHGHLLAALHGVCNECSGPMTLDLQACEDHATEGVCGACDRRFDVLARFECGVCRTTINAPPRTLAAFHPAVVAFYYERGVPFQYDLDTYEDLHRRGDLVSAHEQELRSTDPLRVAVTVRYDGDELCLTMDEGLNVVEVTETAG